MNPRDVPEANMRAMMRAAKARADRFRQAGEGERSR